MHPLSPFRSTNLVLLFHLAPSISWFRNALRTINRLYKFISIEKIESYYYDHSDFNNRCHICFDDGDRSFYENLFPVLKEMNIPATLFVSPKVISAESNYWFQELDYIRNHLDDKLLKESICEILNCNYAQIKKYRIFSIFKSMKLKDILQVIETIKKKYNIHIDERFNITKDQLNELNNSGIITIGAHTMNHPILKNEGDTDAEKEIRESVQELSKLLGREIKYFAYPNGTVGLDYSAREQLILQENKIKLGFTTNRNFFSNKTDPLGIPRGGCSGLQRETGAQILVRLSMLPVWDTCGDIIKLGRRPETQESRQRRQLRDLGIFK